MRLRQNKLSRQHKIEARMPVSTKPNPNKSRQALVASIRERSQALLQKAAPLCAAHRARLPDPEIRFDLRGLAAGQAQWRRNTRPLIRFNLAIAKNHEQAFLERTVPHEIAHLVTTACHGRTRPHGREWQAVMAFFGVKEVHRCHDFTVDEADIRRQRCWIYDCGCSSHELSTTRHNRIAAGKTRYYCRRCQGELKPRPMAQGSDPLSR